MGLERFKKVSELSKDETLKLPIYLIKLEEKKNRNGGAYVTLTCFDGQTTFSCNMFDMQEKMLSDRGITEGDVYTISITKNANGFINVNDIYDNQYEDVSLKDFGQKIDENVDELFDALISAIEKVEDEKRNGDKDTLASLAIKLLKENEKEFKHSSAAVTMHHEKSGGLLLHSYNVTKGCFKLLDVYPDCDRELLICGAALHDIGKMKEYTTSELGIAQVTPMAQGIGHAIYGIQMIDREAQKGNYNEERVNLLESILASHHGTPEKGACAFPIIPEAVIVHACDELDATYDEFKKALLTVEAGQNSDKKPVGLDSKVYKPTYEK